MRVSRSRTSPIEPGELEPGLIGFISWARLENALRSAGEITAKERIVALHLDQRGVSYKIVMDAPPPPPAENQQ